MTKCPKCGVEIKYIPLGYEVMGPVAIVEQDYIEVINDRGRVVKGHLRHRCLKTKDGKADQEG